MLYMVAEKRIGVDDECIGLQCDEGCEDGVDLAFGAGVLDRELYPLRAGRLPHAWDYEGGILIGRIHQQGKRTGAGSQFGKQVEQLLR